MKHLITIFCFILCLSVSAQTLQKKENIQLPPYLSLIEYKTIKNDPTLKTDLEAYTFSIEHLEKMRRGHFVISPNNTNKNFSYLELPTIDLKKELRNVMHKIPGESVLAGPKGFTL